MCQHCDHEDLLKADSNGEGDIWRPHENPFIRDLIEKWTSHGLNKLGDIHAELFKWVAAVYHKPSALPPPQKPGAFVRWNDGELAAVKLYLESLPPEQFTVDDWMLVIDYLVQKFLPHDVMMDDAKWQSARASMMGRVEASMGRISAIAAGQIAMAVPFKQDAIIRAFGMTKAQHAALEFGQARCCQYVANVTEGLRSKLKLAVIHWQEQAYLGTPSAIAKRDLQGRLLDIFAVANMDWRRLAMTELADNAMNGMIASMPAGTKVKRLEMYNGACRFCRSIDGAVFTVVDPAKKGKDPATEMWAGKSNYGRSQSLRKRIGNGLVERTPDELWTVSAGPVHPHCRGRWLRIRDAVTGEDPRFSAWLSNHFSQKKDDV